MTFPLRRTASEESVTVQRPGGGQFEIISVNNNNRRKRPGHRKGKAPVPPRGSKTSPNIVRSNSVNQVRHWENSMDWYRSKSTTRLNSEDSDDTCSTLSDEDSTPHVSRSNSYGRSEDNQAGYTCQQQDDTTYDIYLHDERTLDMGTNLENAFIDNERRRANERLHKREFDSFSCETPPGYEESLYRQRILKLHNRSSSYISASPVNNVSSSNHSNHLSDKAIEKQSELSAKAKAVFEESLRQYENNKPNKENPPPLPPKTDRPPLPPKQRGRRSVDPDSQSSDDQTYVNSAEIAHARQSRNRTRLNVNSQSPAPVTVNNRSHLSEEKEEFVYGNYYSGSHSGTKVSVPVRQSDSKDVKVNPPSLPPKELRVAEVSDTKNQIKKKSVSTTRIVGTNSKPPMKSVETQTDENEFYYMYDDGYKVDEETYNNTDSEYSPESNRSMSPDFSNTSVNTGATYYRVQETPNKSAVPEHYYLGGNVYNTAPSPAMFERPVSASPAGLARQAGRRKLEPVASVPTGRNPHSDPVITGEINWSVSQLRSLFNQGLQNDTTRKQLQSVDPSFNDNLGYRASPARKQFLETRLNYPGDYVNMYNDNQHTDSDQESYV